MAVDTREGERVYVVVVAYMEVVEAGILAAAVKNRRLSRTPVCLMHIFSCFVSHTINSSLYLLSPYSARVLFLQYKGSIIMAQSINHCQYKTYEVHDLT